jgi:hypothetical protein
VHRADITTHVMLCNKPIRLFRIISILSKFCYFRPLDHVISMELLALNFRCQCTQQKLQSICVVLTFDPQLKKILTFAVKDRYQLNYFICIKDFNAETDTSLKLNLFSFFICGCQHHQFHSNSVNTGGRLPICSDVKTRKRRNVVGIDMIRNNRIAMRFPMIFRSHNRDNLFSIRRLNADLALSCFHDEKRDRMWIRLKPRNK